MIIKYSSNNSGGGFWLNDQDWINLDAAGWTVEWLKDDPYHKDTVDAAGKWLGTPAFYATREADSIESAIAEWESVTGQDASDPGCSCCGNPHNFYEEWASPEVEVRNPRPDRIAKEG